jgi:hypothetical protein
MAVGSTDLYHVANRDLPYIFKVQMIANAHQRPSNSLPSNSQLSITATIRSDDSNSVVDSISENLETKIKEYRTKLDVENKVLVGADRLVQQSKGAFKQQASYQYQQCVERISILHSELNACLEQLEHSKKAPIPQEQSLSLSATGPPSPVKHEHSAPSIGSSYTTSSPHRKRLPTPLEIEAILGAASNNDSTGSPSQNNFGHHFRVITHDELSSCRACHRSFSKVSPCLACPSMLQLFEMIFQMPMLSILISQLIFPF